MRAIQIGFKGTTIEQPSIFTAHLASTDTVTVLLHMHTGWLIIILDSDSHWKNTVRKSVKQVVNLEWF